MILKLNAKLNAEVVSDLVKVKVANKTYGIYTAEAYAELKLRMSSKDLSSHTTHVVYLYELENFNDITTVGDLLGSAA